VTGGTNEKDEKEPGSNQGPEDEEQS